MMSLVTGCCGNGLWEFESDDEGWMRCTQCGQRCIVIEKAKRDVILKNERVRLCGGLLEEIERIRDIELKRLGDSNKSQRYLIALHDIQKIVERVCDEK